MITEILKNDPAQALEYFKSKVEFSTGPMEIHHQMQDKADINIIDVRAQKDFQQGHVPGAKNLPKDQWSAETGLDRDKVNILYCYSQTCHLAARAAVMFAEKGYSVMEMDGGFQAWSDDQLPVEK